MANFAKELVDKAKGVYDRFKSQQQEPSDGMPAENHPNLGNVVGTLRDEARTYRDYAFAQTKDDRFGYAGPLEFWQDVLKLEAGNHYEVYGRRNKDSNERWKQEIVDDEIQRQIRVRSSYVTANWHDVQINPNIENISEIFDKERHNTEWGKTIKSWQKRASIYGEAWLHSYLDKSKDPRGLAREMVCEVGSVLLSPYAFSKEREDGCWYLVHQSMITDHQVKADYPDVDTEMLATITNDKSTQILVNYRQGMDKPLAYTRAYEKLVLWCDDPKMEGTPYTEAETQIEHATLLKGGEINAHRLDNHSKHVAAHQEWLLSLEGEVPEDQRTPEDQKKLSILQELMAMHIEEHAKLQKRDKDQGLRAGMQRKYPYGRKIVTIAGQVVEDVPNPYGLENCDWRRLWHQLKNEEVPGRIDGRGDVEILWNTNKVMDQALSRIADNTIVAGIPKQWFHVDDKQNVGTQLSNDPLEPGFYEHSAPVFRQAHVAPENMEIYNVQKANASRDLGVSKSIHGEAPTNKASNQLAQTLLKQSEIMVTGELNVNMNDCIEDIVETRIMLWKKFYTEPRTWYINGKEVTKTLSRELTIRKVTDPKTGEVTEEAIAELEITIRPGSNVPNRWENQIGELINLAETKDMPPEQKNAIWLLIMDLLGEKYPQVAKNGEFYQASKALTVGQKVLEDQQRQQEAAAKDRSMIESTLKRKALSHLAGKDLALTSRASSDHMDQMMKPENGNQPQE